MNRRDILKGMAAIPLLAYAGFGQSAKTSKVIKPKGIKPGNTVGIVAPSSAVPNNGFERAVQNIADLGFKIKLGKYVSGRHRFFSGTDEQRLHDLHWAFNDPEVDGIWCLRGGSGAPRLLPNVNFNVIKKNPKVFIGYSDITALHTAIFQRTGLITFHGPVTTSEYSDYTKKHVLSVITKFDGTYKIEPSAFNIERSAEAELFKSEVITKGKARGRLIGGNLTLLAALAGTPYALKDVKGKILFIEDINEAPYKVDRLLTQLRQSVDMKQLAGVACGVFDVSNHRPGDDPSQSMTAAIKDRLGDLGIPVIYGMSFGHIRDQFTLPVGVNAELDTDNGTLTLLESAVV